MSADTKEQRSERTLVFISDLHLAGDPEKDDCFAQEELADLFSSLLGSATPVDLVLAGDFVDLLQLMAPAPERVSAFRNALEGGRNTVALARLRAFTADPRHRTICLIGNHDSEMGWNGGLRDYLIGTGVVDEIGLSYAHTYRAATPDGASAECLVYCEHGNDYDGVNTIGDYTNPAVTPLGAHIVTDLVNYLEPLGRHASIDAPTSIADIDNIHPLGVIPWWFLSNYFYQQVRRVVKYVLAPALILYLVFHLLPLYFLFDRFGTGLFARGFRSLPDIEAVLALLVIAFDSSALLAVLIGLLVRYDFARTRRRYGLQDIDVILRRGARHYRTVCETLVRGELRPVHWPADQPWHGADLFVYGHTHEQGLTAVPVGNSQRAFANTGTWTRKVVRVRTYIGLPPVFVPVYELTYVVARPEGAALRVELWERPKALSYRLPWTERLATLRRVPRQPRAHELVPRLLEVVTLPYHRAAPAPSTNTSEPEPGLAARAGD